MPETHNASHFAASYLFLKMARIVAFRIAAHPKPNPNITRPTIIILKGQNLQAAANALYIHKNTMYNRLLKIKEIFMVNFDNPALHIKLHVSILIYAYIGILNIQFLDLCFLYNCAST